MADPTRPSPAIYHVSDVVADEVSRLVGSRHLLLLTDFDGTLSDLAPTPDQAVLASTVVGGIASLAALPTVTVGVVSGRRMADVAARVGPGTEFVAGLHGLEIASPEGAFHHPALPGAEPIIRRIVTDARRVTSWCPGVFIEDKTYSVTCHVRRATAEDGGRALGQFVALAQAEIESGLIRLLPGSMAFELLPGADWHKGRGVEWIRSVVAARIPAPILLMYLGDDRTDEDAFAMVGTDGLAIGVGDRPHHHLIRWRLAGPASVGRFFAALRNRLETRTLSI